jgi:hypothetical protein
MTITDYILDITLIALVLVQIRGRRLTVHSLLLPVATVGFAVVSYLRTIPTAGNGLYLVVAAAAAGVTLGALCGVLTFLRPGPGGVPYAKAGVAAAALWVAGTGTRLAFQLYATHGGGAAVARFSAAHHITIAAWTTALILMAVGEVAARTLVLAWRAYGSREATWRTLSPAPHELGSPSMASSGDRVP